MKNILIIGGSHGISQQLSHKLRSNGHNVTIANRTGEGEAHQVFDATKPTELTLPSSLDGLVYAPGSISLKPFHRISSQEILDDFKLNALAAAEVIQQAMPALKKSVSASVLLFSSVAVQTGLPFHASIAMAKGAIEGLTRSLAAELSPKIRVNAIAPSLTDTPLAAHLLNSDAKRDASNNRHPLKMVGMAEDIAALAYFLLSDASKFITGQVIHADGGMSSVRTL